MSNLIFFLFFILFICLIFQAIFLFHLQKIIVLKIKMPVVTGNISVLNLFTPQKNGLRETWFSFMYLSYGNHFGLNIQFVSQDTGNIFTHHGGWSRFGLFCPLY